MKRHLTTVIIGLVTLTVSCQTSNGDKPSNQLQAEKTIKSPAPQPKAFTINPEAVLKDFSTWYSYTYNNIRLAQDFIGLDADSVAMSKTDFLNQLETGNFVPFKIKMQDKVAVYKLFKLRQPNDDIQSTIKQLASIEKEHLKMEGRELPDYNFTDLKGKKYNKANTKGNTLLLKCWFIRCHACVEEFPELNRLVDKYHDKNDLLFLSLAMDAKPDLITFLKKRQFKYAVVPKEGEYMRGKLGTTAYPTHILVDKKGVILKVTNSIDDMIPFLEKQVGKTTLRKQHTKCISVAQLKK